tara:strand:- start:595 stop:1821 length:1227 start_codon:yes stop_codon:yes gene_type:complete
MNFKFYNDTDTENLIGMVPFFLNGTDFNHDNSIDDYLTTNKEEANYFCTHVFDTEKIKRALSVILEIKKTRNIVWIIESKDEILSDLEYDFLKELSSKFKRNELLLLSAELKKEVSNDLVTSFPDYLIPYQYLHHNRSLIPFSFLELPNDDIPAKEKKILSSARKYNPCRDSFYKIFLKLGGESKYMNSFNEFRYFGVTASTMDNSNKTTSEFVADTETANYFKNKFSDIHNFTKIKGERMLWSEGDYYHELLEEYSKYYFSIVHETTPKDTFTDIPPTFLPNNIWPTGRYGLQFGEKTMLPMTSKSIFFVNSYSDIEKHLNKIGIETFSDLFDVEYDSLMLDRRSKKMFDIIDIVNNLSIEDIKEIYNREDVQEKLEKNYNYILYHRNKTNCRNDHMKFLKSLLVEK